MALAPQGGNFHRPQKALTMAKPSALISPSRRLWLVAVVALVWNLLGVLSFVMTVSASAQMVEALPAAERALHTAMPAWVKVCYGVAVFAGTLGSGLLLLRQRLARPLFVISLVAVVLQMGHALFFSPLLQTAGASAAVMPVLVLLIAAYLAWYAGFAVARGWLR